MEIYSLEIEAQLDVTRSLSKPLNEANNRYDSIGYREHTAEEEKQAEKEYERCKAEYDKERGIPIYEEPLCGHIPSKLPLSGYIEEIHS